MPGRYIYIQSVVNGRTQDPLGAGVKARTDQLLAAEKRARLKAAATARQTSTRSFKYKRPANAASRPGRSSTGGKLTKKVMWKGDTPGVVSLDVAKLDREAEHWIIQEIGTGERARMRTGGQKMPRGRTRNNAQYLRTVKRQKGRRISSGLAFGTGPAGRYVPPGGSPGRQQLYPIQNLSGFAARRQRVGLRRRPLVIRNEIEGQHFVQKGAREGFREYELSMLAAARSTFAGQRYRP